MFATNVVRLQRASHIFLLHPFAILTILLFFCFVCFRGVRLENRVFTFYWPLGGICEHHLCRYQEALVDSGHGLVACGRWWLVGRWARGPSGRWPVASGRMPVGRWPLGWRAVWPVAIGRWPVAAGGWWLAATSG